MAELRKMLMMGPPQAGGVLQTPETAARISERSCPVGWELELVADAETGEPWGYCKGCGVCWRLRGGVVEYVQVPPVVALYTEFTDETWQGEGAVAEAISRGLTWGNQPVSERAAYLEWRATPDGPGVPLEAESVSVKWSDEAARAVAPSGYASGGVTAGQAESIRSAWLSAREWQACLLPPGR